MAGTAGHSKMKLAFLKSRNRLWKVGGGLFGHRRKKSVWNISGEGFSARW